MKNQLVAVGQKDLLVGRKVLLVGRKVLLGGQAGHQEGAEEGEPKKA